MWSLFLASMKAGSRFSITKYLGENSNPKSTRHSQLCRRPEAVDLNGRFQMQRAKNWILPKEINANRLFWDSHWLEIWSNHLCLSMGPNGGSVAMVSCRPIYKKNRIIYLAWIFNHLDNLTCMMCWVKGRVEEKHVQ
jgi:hypothetical protein